MRLAQPHPFGQPVTGEGHPRPSGGGGNAGRVDTQELGDSLRPPSGGARGPLFPVGRILYERRDEKDRPRSA